MGDIGQMMGPYFEMSRQLGIEVAGLEYSGYGCSSGSPSAANTYADIEAAYNYLIAQGVPAEKIIAYGQSVGSGPATYIASKQTIGGVVLHSPLMSGIKVIDPHPDKCCRPSCIFGCCDFYPNDQRMRKAACPAFVIHGQADDIVPFHHGQRLSNMTPAQHRWPGYFPVQGGHNNIVETNIKVYFEELTKFVQHVAQRAGGGIQSKPVQLEMQPSTGVILGAREVDRDTEIGVSYQEPVVGPEDNRYAGMRRDKVNKDDARNNLI